jgi:hypothetical protein
LPCSPDLAEADRNRAYAWSVMPALLAWVALPPPSLTSIVLVLGFWLHFSQDVRLARRMALPDW